jgi:thiamine-phosphate pyrophosphorylase
LNTNELSERLRLYLVADFTRRPPSRVLEATAAALRGGVTAVQYRDKELHGVAARQRRAEDLAWLVREAGALFVVNDDPELALAVGADAVHLGPGDLSVGEARARFGQALLLGGSAGTAQRARELAAEGADYLGVGAIFEARASKPDASEPRGLSALAEVGAVVRIPLLAIGGIGVSNAELAVSAGAVGVAVVRALLDAEDPEAAARALRDAVERGRARHAAQAAAGAQSAGSAAADREVRGEGDGGAGGDGA